MNNPNPANCLMNCDHCGGLIEYPQSAAGETVACPHCRKPTFLIYQSAAASAQPSSKSLSKYEPLAQYKNPSQPQSGIADLEFYVRQMMQDRFLKDSATKDSKIKPFSLVHEYGNKYRGLIEIQTGTNLQTANVDVTCDGRNIVWEITRLQNLPPSSSIQNQSKPMIPDGVKAFFWLVVTIICGCLLWWLTPITYHTDKAAIIGAIDNQPYRLAVENYLRDHANDPSSVEIVSLGEPSKPWSNGTRLVKCTFRAKNGFGALVLTTWAFWLRPDNSVAGANDQTKIQF